MNGLIELFTFLSFLFIAFIIGYAVGYIPMLINRYKQLKDDIKKAEEDLFLIKELYRKLKDQTKWDYKITQQKNSEQS